MDKKKFIASIYLYEGKVVAEKDHSKVLAEDPVSFSKTLSENNIDAIIIYDLSENDMQHDTAIGIIKRICLSAEIPVIGTGHIFRMEDVKKLLYAGCHYALLDYSTSQTLEITEEVSKKFGKDKLIASIDSLSIYENNKEQIDTYFDSILFTNELELSAILSSSTLPIIAKIPEISLDKTFEYLDICLISGICGDYVNLNYKEITAIKHLCFERHIPVQTFEGADDFSTFKLDSAGLIPVVVQDYKTSEVLMVAYMNEESYQLTLKTKKMTYYSRSRQELWLKGETSGHYQYVKSLTIDCDRDTLLAKVSQVGAACHTGNYSCFFTPLAESDYEETNPLKVFEDVFHVILDRKIHPKEGSYTNYLFDKGIDKILKKLGEEATEIVIAAKNPNPDEIKYEISDFLYHMMVLMAEKGVSWEEITSELARR